MKSGFYLPPLQSAAVAAILFTGCLSKPVPVTTRHFELAPITSAEPVPAGTERLSVGIGFVKMPPQLLHDSLVVRTGPNEIDYLENAQWAERLDQCFQRTVAANLSRVLSSDNIYFADWSRDQVMVSVFISVQQFDVDTQGHGTLIARWRIAAADRNTPVKSGCVQLEHTGAAPRGNPQVIATTLSDLTAEFSRQLAIPIRESAEARQRDRRTAKTGL